MANSRFDNDLMRFLQQTAEYFEIDGIDHVFNNLIAANEDTQNKEGDGLLSVTTGRI